MTEVTGPACTCCTGIVRSTPVRVENRPALPSISYRIGTHATFKASILAALSDPDVAALGGLGARTDADLTIAIADGFAVMADVLTFYQERIANETFLRTATERRSVLELARLIGYELAPGVAADAWLAFTLDEPLTPGSPPPAPVTIDAGTRVQSVPGPDERAQTFETVEAIVGRADRNALRLQSRERQPIRLGQRELVLVGTGHQLAPGDVVLIVGDERLGDSGSERWDARLIRTVEPDDASDTTRLTWLEGLGSGNPHVEPASKNAAAFVFRLRASLFGHNAPDPRLINLSDAARTALVQRADASRWKGFGLANRSIDLDQSYPRVVPDSWVVLLSQGVPHFPSSLPGYAELYRARTVGHQSVSAFGLASKVTRVGLDTNENLTLYDRRETLVLCQTDELPLAERRVRAPVYGDRLAFDGLVAGLAVGQPLAVSGAAQHLLVTEVAGAISLRLDDTSLAPLTAGDRLAMLAAPTQDDGAGGRRPVDPADLEAALDPLLGRGATVVRWRLQDRDGRVGTVDAPGSTFVLDPALAGKPGEPGDPTFSEVVRIAAPPDSIKEDRDRTTIRLADGLVRAYDRLSARVNGNVAPATHGESVGELVGGGDAAKRNQRFALRQAPLTYVGADTPSGSRSTLTVRVDGTAWEERPTLYAVTPDDRAYTVEIGDDATADILFGDGNEGARLPTGAANVRATYRKGIGTEGNLRSGQLTTLLIKPMGVGAVVNPEAASGGEDPEAIGAARDNAPLTVLTLDRAVSRLDYEDFARSFSGIAKAKAAWVPTGAHRGVAITVAGIDGAAIADGGKAHTRLLKALRSYGDPLLPLVVRSYRPVRFLLGVDVKVDPREEAAVVLARVRTALEDAFAFGARSLGSPVSVDEVAAIAHRVRGVVAIDLTACRRSDQPATPAVRSRLDAAPTAVTAGGIVPAELLTIDAVALNVGTMP